MDRSQLLKLAAVVLAAVVGLYLGIGGAGAPGGVLVPASGTVLAGNAARSGGSGSTASPTAVAKASPGSGAGAAKAGASTAGAPAGASAPGPLLSSTRYWPAAHQVYPGTPDAAGQRALAGFQLAFQSAGAGLEKVTVTNRGGHQSATFRRTDRLYFIEGGMGDDGFGSDTNMGDDAFILTDAGGHIVGH